MSLALRLDVRQSQGLVMTPQLQQAIKLLQLSNLELAAYVDQELEQNPFLERGEEPGDGTPAPEPVAASDASSEIDGAIAMADHDGGDGWSGGSDEGWTREAQDALPDGLGIDRLAEFGRGGRTDFSDHEQGLDDRASRPKTLRDHLAEQLSLEIKDGPARLIGLYLIDLVDDAGYLRADLDEVSERLQVSRAALDALLCRLQQFDPPGVCARTVAECLALQLREAGRLDPAMAALVQHLDLVAHADLQGLLRVTGVLPDDLPEMIAELKALNPKPGLAFAPDEQHTVVPDIFVYPTGRGVWRVELNSATLPRVLVNSGYYAEVARRPGDERARSYLNERFQCANWLFKALDQRARTVLRVAEAVVERQRPFLERGVQFLRPLVLRDIATVTALHESTISRATADKYVATPRGNFPFKYFFSNGLPGADGDGSHSAEAVRQQIKSMIEREMPASVLSDDQIVEVLKTSGVIIARRTVAKYRESLGIPSSVQRRRSKALRLA